MLYQLSYPGYPGLQIRSFLGGVGFLTTLSRNQIFCPTPNIQLDHFYITLLSWEFLLKWYNLFWNFCWKRVFLLCIMACT